MFKLFSNYKVAAVISAVLTLVADLYIHFVFGLICYIPLFIALQRTSKREAFKSGVIFGLTLSLLSLYWMVPGAERFTGNSMLYGLIVYILSCAVGAIYFAVVNWSFASLKFKEQTSSSYIYNGLLISAIYVIGESVLALLAKGFPWFGFHSANSTLNNLYAIQPASMFGMHGISFMVVFINYLFAWFLYKKQIIKLSIPLIIIIAYLVSGSFILKTFQGNLKSGNKFKLAILCENIEPEIRWDDNTGNMLVGELLNLDKTATAMKPDISLWSESAIPWTYKPNDDLVNELLKISAPAKITHILGMNTEYHKNIVYNSVYCLLPNGKIAGRYDKRFLLSLIEAPVFGWYVPFFSSSGFLVQNGESSKPLFTPYGKAGVMICNESAVPRSAADMVKNGAQFIVNLSNDGWFNDTYLVDQHFYNVRLRAVETRKDIAINSNNGYSGLITSSGDIVMKEFGEEPFVKTVSVTPNSYITLSTKFPLLFVYLCAGYCLAVIFMKFGNRKA